MKNAKKFCDFCQKETLIEGVYSEHGYCPNGHILVMPNGEHIVKQPVSDGTNVKGRAIYRKSESGIAGGAFCNEKGD